MPLPVDASPEVPAVRFIDSVEIGLGREETVRLLSDPRHLPMWLRGLVRHEPISGTHGEVGTVSKVVLRNGADEIEAIETITVREPADLTGLAGEDEVHFERELVADGMRNVTRDRLIELNPRRTRWESENEYLFSSLPLRLLAPLMRRTFQKQTRQHMQDFKAYAEQGIDVRSTDG